MGDKGIPGPPEVWNDLLRETGTAQLYQLGTERTTFDGDIYVYVKAGATALAAGRLMTYLTTGTNEQTVTVAHGIGTTTVTVTDASSAENDFQDGYLVVTAGTGIGECYRIKSNTISNGTTITCELYEGLATAWSTSDTDVTMYKNRYNGIVVNPYDGQQHPCGVTQWPIPALHYGWIMKKGYGALDIEMLGSPAAGGQEKDEKIIIASTTQDHDGRGSITGSAVSTMYASATSGETTCQAAITAVSSAYALRPPVAYVVMEADCTNDEACLVAIDL